MRAKSAPDTNKLAPMASDLEKGRAHYEKREWAAAYDCLARASKGAMLAADDLDRLVWASALVGNDEAFISNLEGLHLLHAGAGRMQQAARAAFWIGFRLMAIGSSSQGGAWLTRAERHLTDAPGDCVERGYLLLPGVFGDLSGNNNDAASARAGEAAEIGRRHGDSDLTSLASNLQGRAMLRRGKVEEGLALLDEAMVAVVSGEVSPLVSGIVYCNVIASCNQVYAIDRAREWTEALAHWVKRQPQLVNFTGSCHVHRSEVMQLCGEWTQAYEEVTLVCDRVCQDSDPEVFADACYQLAELLRLRGQFAEAEASYRLASQNGRDPQPGLALLGLAQGRVDDAIGAIERAVSTTVAAWERARLLPACFEIMRGTGNLDRARDAAAELSTIAREFGTEIVGALAAQAEGILLLDDGKAREAVDCLRRAFTAWQRSGAPYLAARVRVWLATAYRALGDDDGANLELDAARSIFKALGALPDLQSLEPASNLAPTAGLSARELEVLRLLARGMTNKAIAAELGLSERTIDRHVSNIFIKLHVTTRSGATAAAYRQDLISRTG